MQDKELYAQILGVREPWQVERVELKLSEGEVHVHLRHDADVSWPCAECGTACTLYDHQPERRWRHLDTCQYRTILHASPLRSNCAECFQSAIKTSLRSNERHTVSDQNST